MNQIVKPGDVLHLNEPDYLYGTGVLRLRVTKVGVMRQLGGNDWLELEGLTLRTDGSPMTNQPRPAVVRVRALPTAIQQPGAGSR